MNLDDLENGLLLIAFVNISLNGFACSPLKRHLHLTYFNLFRSGLAKDSIKNDLLSTFFNKLDFSK